LSNLESIAYIPLFGTSFVAVLIFSFLILIKKRKTARVSFITFVSVAVFALASLICAIRLLANPENFLSDIQIYFFFLFGASVLFIPYCIMLCTFEPKKIEKLVPPSYNKLHSESTNTPIGTAKQEDVELREKLINLSKEFMLKASSSISAKDGLSDLLDYINKTYISFCKADGGAILMIDDFEDVISVKAFEGDFPPPFMLPSDLPHKPVRVATSFKFSSFPLSDNIFGQIALAGKPELIDHPELDDRVYQNGPEDWLECGTYMFIPMKIEDSVIGLVALSRNRGNTAFTKDDLTTASLISDFSAASIRNIITVKDHVEHNSLTKETDIASNIQNTLKPARIPAIQGLNAGTLWQPAEGVCGDFYDVVVSRKDRVSFVMGDIAGKGINSIIVMTMIRSMLRLVVNTTQSAGKILSWVNKGICGESFTTDHFGSIALLNYDPTSHLLEFATGGNAPIYYFDSKTKDFSLISNQSEPIGVEKSTEYKDFVQKIKSGDIIIMYTDGIIETLNDKGEQYSTDSLLKVVTENSSFSGKDIANLIKADIKSFSGSESQHDDQTLLVLKFE